jgi:Leucine-rich repeat (LRR) protein
MKNLRELHLDNNKLQGLPSGLDGHKHIIEISLENQDASTFRLQVKNLVQLQRLRLSGTNVREIER